MKRLLLASAIVSLGLAGTIGTANAVIPTADHVGLWSHDTAGAGDPLVNAVPSSRVGLISTTPFDAASGALNFNLTGASPSTEAAFLAAIAPHTSIRDVPGVAQVQPERKPGAVQP